MSIFQDDTKVKLVDSPTQLAIFLLMLSFRTNTKKNTAGLSAKVKYSCYLYTVQVSGMCDIQNVLKEAPIKQALDQKAWEDL